MSKKRSTNNVHVSTASVYSEIKTMDGKEPVNQVKVDNKSRAYPTIRFIKKLVTCNTESNTEQNHLIVQLYLSCTKSKPCCI